MLPANCSRIYVHGLHLRCFQLVSVRVLCINYQIFGKNAMPLCNLCVRLCYFKHLAYYIRFATLYKVILSVICHRISAVQINSSRDNQPASLRECVVRLENFCELFETLLASSFAEILEFMRTTYELRDVRASQELLICTARTQPTN